MFNFSQLLTNPEKGSSMLEYALLAALLSVASIGALGALSDEVETTFETASNAMAGGAPILPPQPILGN